MKRIILASSSPRRKEILERVGLPFEVIPSQYEEDNSLVMPPGKLVEHLALGKAQWVADRYPTAVVVGSDSLISFGGGIIGKQASVAELTATLRSFSGKAHSVFSGIAIIEGDHVVTASVETKVYFRELDDQEIANYAARPQEWQGKAGGYGIQDLGGLFIERIEGDYNTVVGLPLHKLALELRAFGIDLLLKQE